MKQINDCTLAEIRSRIKAYYENRIFSRVINCYERLMFLGELRRGEYLRLAALYRSNGNAAAAGRTIQRYKSIYK